jgi:hypothetical protein
LSIISFKVKRIDFVVVRIDTLGEVPFMSYGYMNYFTHAHCLNCATTSIVEHNGLEGYCFGCGTRGVLHSCPDAHPLSQPFWLPLYETAVDAVCPWCSPVRQVGERLASSEEAPEWLRELGDIAIKVVMIAGPVLLAKAVLDAVTPRKNA